MRIYSVKLYDLSLSAIEEEYRRIDTVTRGRVDKMRAEARKATLAGRALLRKGIRELFGRDDYELTYNENGKPELDFCWFSISHSGDTVVCVIADTPVGVDIERMREIRSSEHYPLFTADEAERINRSGKPSEMFLRLWTQKEAYVKMKGGAMSRDGGIDIERVQDVVFQTEISGNYMISTCISVR